MCEKRDEKKSSIGLSLMSLLCAKFDFGKIKFKTYFSILAETLKAGINITETF